MIKNILSIAVFIFAFSSCSTNNVKQSDLITKQFDSLQLNGSFAWYNNAAGTFTVHNFSRYKDSAQAPGSSFYLLTALVAIETGRVSDEKKQIEYVVDGTKKLESLKNAFATNNESFFKYLNQAIGKDTLQRWIDSLSYGNKKLPSMLDGFETSQTLLITPDEQLGLLKRLYFSQLPFQKRTQDIVKRIIPAEINANYQFVYLNAINKITQNAQWILGWTEEHQHVYFFVYNTRDNNNNANNILFIKKLVRLAGFSF